MSHSSAGARPNPWTYGSIAAVCLLVLIPLWTVFVMTVVQPASLMMENQTMSNRLMWLVAGPVVAIALLLGWRWQAANRQADLRQQQAADARALAQQASEQPKKEYVLEVISLGVTLDKLRQGKLWDAIAEGNAYTTIREMDPNKYPWSDTDKLYGGQEESLENGAAMLPRFWAIPVFNAEPPDHNDQFKDLPTRPVIGLAGGAIQSSVMSWHLMIAATRRFEERPDRLLAEIFAFFDANPDVPFVILNSDDSMGLRNGNRPPKTPRLVRDGHYVPEMPNASTLIVLARRERVEPLRPFAWEDPDNDFGQNKLRWSFIDLMEALPHPDKEADPKAHTDRWPTVAEWLPAARTFTQRDDVYPKYISRLNPYTNYPPIGFKPTPWFPVPWTTRQLEVFDRLPTLGYLHRPVFVPTVDAHGQPLARREARAAALAAGWQQALQTLPEAERNKAPARVVVGSNGNTTQTIALHSVLDAWTHEGGPQLDPSKPTQWIDTDRRLGNTGAATWFMQMAIGVMGSYREGGTSAAINLRDDKEASIVFVSPPPDDKRQTQQHPYGGDVFKQYNTPSIDPKNYQPE